jgi:hypothetical protein
MTLIGPWTPALIDRLNTVADRIWANWNYNIQLVTFETEAPQNERSTSFFGNGRWAFCHNMEELGRWTGAEAKEKSEYASIYGELMRGMRENELTIEVSYSDEEGGCLVLYRQNGILSSDGKELAYSVTSEENFEYNWNNYEDVTGDTEDLDLLIASLCEQLGFENDDNGLIERWARVHTYPHCSSYENLGENTQTEFKEAFPNMSGSRLGGDENA